MLSISKIRADRVITFSYAFFLIILALFTVYNSRFSLEKFEFYGIVYKHPLSLVYTGDDWFYEYFNEYKIQYYSDANNMKKMGFDKVLLYYSYVKGGYNKLLHLKFLAEIMRSRGLSVWVVITGINASDPASLNFYADATRYLSDMVERVGIVYSSTISGVIDRLGNATIANNIGFFVLLKYEDANSSMISQRWDILLDAHYVDDPQWDVVDRPYYAIISIEKRMLPFVESILSDLRRHNVRAFFLYCYYEDSEYSIVDPDTFEVSPVISMIEFYRDKFLIAYIYYSTASLLIVDALLVIKSGRVRIRDIIILILVAGISAKAETIYKLYFNLLEKHKQNL